MTSPNDRQNLRLLSDLGEQLSRAERDAGSRRPRGVLWRLRSRATLRGPLVVGLGVFALGTGVAAATGVISLPPAKPLPQALHDAASAPKLDGVSARVEFTNGLLDSSGLTRGSDPVISGGTSRLWASSNGDVRLELQANGGSGDAQLLLKGDEVWLYHAAANTVYKATLPPVSKQEARQEADRHEPPTLAAIRRGLSRLGEYANLSDAKPSNVAGHPAYTLRTEPKRHGGLVGGTELAWDAVNGAPLRAAVYAKQQSDPVLELKATSVDFGPVPAATFAISPPKDAKVVDLNAQTAPEKRDPAGKPKPVAGLADVQSRVAFTITAPDTLAGMPRKDVRLVGKDKDSGALVTYGEGLDGIAVLQTAATAPGKSVAAAPKASGDGRDGGGMTLPGVTIGSVKGQKLSTPLGTIVTFDRGGVRYVVLGSVISSTAEAAAGEL